MEEDHRLRAQGGRNKEDNQKWARVWCRGEREGDSSLESFSGEGERWPPRFWRSGTRERSWFQKLADGKKEVGHVWRERRKLGSRS